MTVKCDAFLRRVWKFGRDKQKSEIRPYVTECFQEICKKDPPDGHIAMLIHRVACELTYLEAKEDNYVPKHLERLKFRLMKARTMRVDKLDREDSLYIMRQMAKTANKGKETMTTTTVKRRTEKSVNPNIGTKSGLKIFDTWILYLRENETCAKKKKMTDAKILECIKEEFPDKPSAFKYSVKYVRKLYNTGYFGCKDEGKKRGQNPKLKSHEWTGE